jgi:hypothetical protein
MIWAGLDMGRSGHVLAISWVGYRLAMDLASHEQAWPLDDNGWAAHGLGWQLGGHELGRPWAGLVIIWAGNGLGGTWDGHGLGYALPGFTWAEVALIWAGHGLGWAWAF